MPARSTQSRQAQFQQKAAEQQVLTDVQNAYEGLRRSEQMLQLYDKGYLDKATQSLDITKFSYEHGAASLLDFLDAERSYRSTELSYRQALATYMTSLEQLRQARGDTENCSKASLGCARRNPIARRESLVWHRKSDPNSVGRAPSRTILRPVRHVS